MLGRVGNLQGPGQRREEGQAAAAVHMLMRMQLLDLYLQLIAYYMIC